MFACLELASEHFPFAFSQFLYTSMVLNEVNYIVLMQFEFKDSNTRKHNFLIVFKSLKSSWLHKA